MSGIAGNSLITKSTLNLSILPMSATKCVTKVMVSFRSLRNTRKQLAWISRFSDLLFLCCHRDILKVFSPRSANSINTQTHCVTDSKDLILVEELQVEPLML